MGNVQIVSTLQNKAMQKKTIHHNSSTVFWAVCSLDGCVDTEVSLLNHFIIKRGIADVVATVEFRDLNGELVNTFKMNMDEPRAYSIRASEHISGEFIGSIYVYFNSNENLAVPFCAVMCSIKTQNSVCGVHTYGRRLETKELSTYIDLKSTVETGWTARDTSDVKSFAVLHGGNASLTLDVKLEISNSTNKKLFIEREYVLEPFGTLIIIPQDLSDKVVAHLGSEKGHIKVYIEGLSGIFPRMLCGNFLALSQTTSSLSEANEIQFTHTNFDFSTIEQPDAGSSLGYYNQPSMPAGYGIIYPVETEKSIKIGEDEYSSNTLQHIEVGSMSQLEVKASEQKIRVGLRQTQPDPFDWFNDKKVKETITVKVSEKTMKVGKIEYYTHKWKNDRVEAQGTYHKDKDSISGWNHSLVNIGGDGFCLTQQRTVLIDRISGTINLKQIDLGECKGRKSSFLYEFDGKCKKHDRTF